MTGQRQNGKCGPRQRRSDTEEESGLACGAGQQERTRERAENAAETSDAEGPADAGRAQFVGYTCATTAYMPT